MNLAKPGDPPMPQDDRPSGIVTSLIVGGIIAIALVLFYLLNMDDTGDWVLRQSKDPFTDVISAEQTLSGSSADIILSCKTHEPVKAMLVSNYADEDMRILNEPPPITSVRMRFDSGDPFTLRTPAYGIFDWGGKAGAFVRKLADTTTLVVQFDQTNIISHPVVFNVRGAGKAVKDLQEACA